MGHNDRETREVYSKALDWDEAQFSYWVGRARQELDWIFAHQPALKNGHGKSLLVAGGSGRHAVAALEAGFDRVTFIDLTPLNTDRLTDIKARNRYANLEIISGDILADLPSGPFDLVLCNGVVQHLSDPQRGVHLLLDAAAQGGTVFFDCYRAGCLYFTLVEKLREAFVPADRPGLLAAIDLLHLDSIPLSFTSASLSERLVDDLFVPYIGYYLESDILAALEQAGFKLLVQDGLPDLDHGLPCHKVVRFLVERTPHAEPGQVRLASQSNFATVQAQTALGATAIQLEQAMSFLRRRGFPAKWAFVVGLMLRFSDWTSQCLDASANHARLRDYLEDWEDVRRHDHIWGGK